MHLGFQQNSPKIWSQKGEKRKQERNNVGIYMGKLGRFHGKITAKPSFFLHV